MADRPFRLYLPSWSHGAVTLKKEDCRHLRARRIKKGEEIEFFDGHGKVCRARLVSLSPAKAVLLSEQSFPPPSLKVALFFPLLAPSKVCFVIENTLPLGVTAYYPVIYERTQPVSFRKEKIEKVAFETMKQCGKVYLPFISPPLHFNQALEMAASFEMQVVASLESSLSFEKRASSYALFVGPEGNFSRKEQECFKKIGCSFITWPDTVFTSELACVIFTTLLLSPL